MEDLPHCQVKALFFADRQEQCPLTFIPSHLGRNLHTVIELLLNRINLLTDSWHYIPMESGAGNQVVIALRPKAPSETD
jgi:hypothetical protein